MALEKRLSEHIRQVEALQKELIQRDIRAEDANRPAAMRKERAATVRDAIARLERRKAEAAARFDAEIAALSAELKTIEGPSDIDLALRRGGGTAKGKDAGKTGGKSGDKTGGNPISSSRRPAPSKGKGN